MSAHQSAPNLGFVLPNQVPAQQAPYPAYPPVQGGASSMGANVSYPSSDPFNQHRAVGPYPPPVYNHQPFPPPIQQQPPHHAPMMNSWHSNTDYQAYLIQATSFHVKQKVELLEAFVGWETENKYTVKDQSGNKLFYVGEQSDCCNRQCCANSRAFSLVAKDRRGMDVLRYERPLDCSCCCGLFCKSEISVSTASGQFLGSTIEEFSICTPKFKIKDATGRTVLRIEGPCITCSCNCGSVIFKVLTKEDVVVGTISKEWGGLAREWFTDADYFSMSFPQDLDCAIKAVLIGALFMIEFKYFEHKNSSANEHMNTTASILSNITSLLK